MMERVLQVLGLKRAADGGNAADDPVRRTLRSLRKNAFLIKLLEPHVHREKM